MRFFDVGGPCVAAAYAVGRTGCWAVGDDYGKPWNGFLAVTFPNGAPPEHRGEHGPRLQRPLPAWKWTRRHSCPCTLRSCTK